MANHKFVQERGAEHEAYITFDPPQNTYRAWYFHSNGHVWEMAGRWNGNMNDMLLLSAELDQNQSFNAISRYSNEKSHECTVAWTDEDGRIGIYGVSHFTRCDPARGRTPGKKSTTASHTPRHRPRPK